MIRVVSATGLLIALAMLGSSCILITNEPLVEGLWQGTAQTTFSVRVWEDTELILEDSWEGELELTMDIMSAGSGSILGEWYWRELTGDVQLVEPSPPLPMTGTLLDDILSLKTTHERTTPTLTQYIAEFSFDISDEQLAGTVTYSEETNAPDVRIIFEFDIPAIVLTYLANP